MMRFGSCVFLFVLASVCAAAANLTGGWNPATIDANTTALLNNAIQQESNYAATVKTRICIKEINGLEQQVVAGMNYRFNVTGCVVDAAVGGTCGELATNATNATNNTVGDGCKSEMFLITLNEELPVNGGQIQILSITEADDSDDGSNPAGEEEEYGISGSGSDSSELPDATNSTSTAVPTSTPEAEKITQTTTAPAPTPKKSAAVTQNVPAMVALVAVLAISLQL